MTRAFPATNRYQHCWFCPTRVQTFRPFNRTLEGKTGGGSSGPYSGALGGTSADNFPAEFCTGNVARLHRS